MADDNYDWMDREREGSSSPALDRAGSARLRERLVAEIQQLRAELSALQASDDAVDFSMQQTCREMIHARQQLFLKLRQ